MQVDHLVACLYNPLCNTVTSVTAKGIIF